MRMVDRQLDLPSTLTFELDEFIDSMIESLGITLEEFEQFYVIEQHPTEIKMLDYDFEKNPKYEFKINHTIFIRHKAVDEIVGDQSNILTQGEI